MKSKVEEIHANILAIPKNVSRDVVIRQIHLINSQIRGLVNYYEATTWVTVAFKRYRQYLQHAAHKRLKKYSVKWIPANKTSTLPSIHSKHKAKIVAIPYKDLWVGVTDLGFAKWEKRFITIRMKRPTAKRDGRYISTGRRKNGRTRGWMNFP